MRKFVLMGLPGTGKTTTLIACVEFLKKQGINANLILTDPLINKRITTSDPVIKQYEEDYKLKISSTIFSAEDPSKMFIKTYGESAMRNLEERLLINIIESSQENDWLDLGGRALLLPGVIKTVITKKIIPIFLYADHETVLKRLAENEGWRKRPTYMLAAEKSSDGKGWITNTELHRKERLEIFIKNATIIISVEKNPTYFLTSKSHKEKKHSVVLCKSSDEIVQEIFTRIKELERAVPVGYGRISSTPMSFFESKSSDKFSDKEQFQKTKEWLEKNLKFRHFT